VSRGAEREAIVGDTGHSLGPDPIEDGSGRGDAQSDAVPSTIGTDERALGRTRGRFLLLVCAFLVAHSVLYHETHFGNQMTKAALDMSCALVEKGSASIDDTCENTNDTAYYEGHYYSGMAPGLSILSVPLYALAKGVVAVLPPATHQRLLEYYYAHQRFPTERTPYDLELLLTSALASAVFGFGLHILFVVAVYSALRRFLPDWNTRTRVFLFLALGSVYLYYFGEFTTQGAALAMLGLGCYYAFARRRDRSTAVVAGALWGLAGTIDYPFFLLGGLGVLGLLLSSPRKNWPVAAGFGFLALAVASYHLAVFGSPLRTPYSFRAMTDLHQSGFYGLALPSFNDVLSYLVAPPCGLLVCSPMLLAVPVALWRLRRSWRTAALPLIVLGAMVVANLLCAVCVPWAPSGFSNIYVGQRFALPALVGLSMLVGIAGSRWVYGLAFVSFLIVHLNQSMAIGLHRPYEYLHNLITSVAGESSVGPSGYALLFKVLPDAARLPTAIVLEIAFICTAAYLFWKHYSLGRKHT
jgi:hypothetical protein